MFDVSQWMGAGNWTAVLAFTVLGFVLGGLWYGPLFGRAWMAAVGKTEAELAGGGMARPMTISFVTAGISALVLALLARGLGAETLGDGALLGLATGAGLIATGMGSDMAFRGDPLALWLIQSGYRVAYCVVMAAVLTVWR